MKEAHKWTIPLIQKSHQAGQDAWSVSSLGAGGSTYGDARSAATLGAVTSRRCGMHLHMRAHRVTLSSAASSRARIGSGTTGPMTTWQGLGSLLRIIILSTNPCPDRLERSPQTGRSSWRNREVAVLAAKRIAGIELSIEYPRSNDAPTVQGRRLAGLDDTKVWASRASSSHSSVDSGSSENHSLIGVPLFPSNLIPSCESTSESTLALGSFRTSRPRVSMAKILPSWRSPLDPKPRPSPGWETAESTAKAAASRSKCSSGVTGHVPSASAAS
jgi:hypothetical protein